MKYANVRVFLRYRYALMHRAPIEDNSRWSRRSIPVKSLLRNALWRVFLWGAPLSRVSRSYFASTSRLGAWSWILLCRYFQEVSSSCLWLYSVNGFPWRSACSRRYISSPRLYPREYNPFRFRWPSRSFRSKRLRKSRKTSHSPLGCSRNTVSAIYTDLHARRLNNIYLAKRHNLMMRCVRHFWCDPIPSGASLCSFGISWRKRGYLLFCLYWTGAIPALHPQIADTRKKDTEWSRRVYYTSDKPDSWALYFWWFRWMRLLRHHRVDFLGYDRIHTIFSYWYRLYCYRPSYLFADKEEKEWFVFVQTLWIMTLWPAP